LELRRGGAVSLRRRRPPLFLEPLEDRCLLSVQMMKDINTDTRDSAPTGIAVINSTTFFAADDGLHGAELWKSAGTAAGLVLVKDIDPGSTGSYPHYLTAVGPALLFFADDGTHGAELWKSDGTAAGTLLVKDINPGSNGQDLP